MNMVVCARNLRIIMPVLCLMLFNDYYAQITPVISVQAYLVTLQIFLFKL